MDIRKPRWTQTVNKANHTEIIEGVMIQVIAIAAWFVIVDFPDKAHQKGFLTKNDADFIKRRIQEDRGDAVPDPLTWAAVGRHLLDLKLWAL